MKKKILSLSLVAMVGLGVVTAPSCKKYEEGPSFTIKSKKARLAGVWKESKTVYANGEVINSNDETTIEYTKDGVAILTVVLPVIGAQETKGTWEFSDDKKNLTVKLGSLTYTNEIILLKNKEMGVKDKDGNKIYFEKQ